MSIPPPSDLKAPPVPWDGREPDSSDWPVLVTGAGGFVGGHIIELAGARRRIRGLTAGRLGSSPAIRRSIGWSATWADAGVRRQALAGVRGVIHAATGSAWAWTRTAPAR